MKIRIGVSFALAALLSGPFAARADDASTIRERMKAASASVQSVVIDMEMTPPGALLAGAPHSINILMIATPGRSKVIAVAGPLHIESYQVEGMVYVHVQPGDSWRKIRYDPAHSPAQMRDFLQAARDEKITLLPDSQEDGVTVGVVQLELQLPVPAGMAGVGPPVTLTCNYDKGTYRMRSCANPTMSMRFTKYNDPANTVELPPGAANAVLIVPKTPAPDLTTPTAAPTTPTLPAPAPTTTPSPAPAATPTAAASSTPTAAVSSTPAAGPATTTPQIPLAMP